VVATLLDSSDVGLIVGAGIDFIVCQGRINPAWTNGQRGETLVTGRAIRMVDTNFQKDLRLGLSSIHFMARR
jgi:hypothetical protein